MRLHVAAQAFPSYQGTQAIIRQMLEAETSAGLSSELVTYAAKGYDETLSFAVHRPARIPLVNERALLRSGPLRTKPMLDVQLLSWLRRYVRNQRPSVIIAHHVEAAMLGLACKGPPVVFFAHTDLEQELPTYASPAFTKMLRLAGATIDQSLVRRCAATAAISPLLHNTLKAQHASVHLVSVPFQLPSTAYSRAQARQDLGLDPDIPVLLYAGNLDAYQGADALPELLVHLARWGHHPIVLMATESEVCTLLQLARSAGVEHQVRVVALAGEAQRVRIHAAADVTLVPRRTPGGLPIKLLDAMARGAAIAASPNACAGYALQDVCAVACDDSPAALAQTVAQLLTQPQVSRVMAQRAVRYIAHQHSATRYLADMQRVSCAALDAALSTRLKRRMSLQY